VTEGDVTPELQVEKKPRARKSASSDSTTKAEKKTTPKKQKSVDGK
jgi:hypothetical protein